MKLQSRQKRDKPNRAGKRSKRLASARAQSAAVIEWRMPGFDQDGRREEPESLDVELKPRRRRGS